MKKNIFIIGSQGYEKTYGGWETFVRNLIYNYDDENTQFYVPDLSHKKVEDKKIICKGNVICPQLYVPKQGYVTMFTFTIKSTLYFKKYIKEHHLKNCVIYILGSKIGPLLWLWRRSLKKLGIQIVMNPDGLEWKREKWAWWIKICFKISERYMIKASDYVVCDSKNIQNYVLDKYAKYDVPSTFIAFGAYFKNIKGMTKKAQDYFDQFQIKPKDYYLIVGRFVPENNYELMIREFMKSKTKHDLVIVCNVEENKFYNNLAERTGFLLDKRIKFVGTVYEDEILFRLRKYAVGYIHGHSVGGTNPSLLEALSITNVNLLYDVCYNHEVAEDAGLFFDHTDGSLKNLIKKVDKFTEKEQKKYGELAKQRIRDEYTWQIIVDKYKDLFEILLK